MAQYYTRASWKSFRGKTKWKGGKPGTGLIHTICGGEIHEGEQVRSFHDGPFPLSGSGKTVIVAELWCTKCGREPRTPYGAGITPEEYFDPIREAV